MGITVSMKEKPTKRIYPIIKKAKDTGVVVVFVEGRGLSFIQAPQPTI